MAVQKWDSSDGRVTLYLGDCLDVVATLADNSVDLVFADPPFPGRTDLGGGKGKLKMWLAPLPRITNRALIKWSAIALHEAAKSVPPEWKWQHTFVWHKPWTCARHWALDVYPHWEAILVLGRGRRRGELHVVQDVIFSRTTKAGIQEGITHPVQTPVEVIEYMVRAFSMPGDLVLDPFMGSGTTGVACIIAGRRFIGIERNEKSFAISKCRIEGTLAQQPLPSFDQALEYCPTQTAFGIGGYK